MGSETSTTDKYSDNDLPKLSTFSRVFSAVWDTQRQGNQYTEAFNTQNVVPTPEHSVHRPYCIQPPQSIFFLDVGGYIGASSVATMQAVNGKFIPAPIANWKITTS